MGPGESAPAGAGGRRVLGDLGVLMLEGGASVGEVRRSLERSGPVTVSVLARTVVVTDRDGGASTLVASGGDDLSFEQAAHASRLARLVEGGTVGLGQVPDRIAAVRAMRRRHPRAEQVVGSALVACGLAAVTRCPWWAVLVALVVGAGVGALSQLLGLLEGGSAVLPFVVALASTLAVGAVAAAASWGPIPLFAVCAPIAILVPGALITNALLDLTATDVVTGSGRLVYGLLVLALMALGIFAGASLTGLAVDPGSVALIGQDAGPAPVDAGAWQQLPPTWVAWVGVAVLAAGVGLAFGSGARLSAVNVVVMTATFTLLRALVPAVGEAAAAGIAAAALFLIARWGERRTLALPAAATFQPAFLLLVPGTVGLVALTGTDSVALTTSLTTFVAICLGVKFAALVADNVPGRRRAAPPPSPPSEGRPPR
ncbi:threonine/serine exporter family protein [Cellulomonas sp. ACRRI]|uniref:threonine/serine exporter family protein n=1 Tax=Cellulomonas sp. ACRRI TaxID=2918188 RepID=UPI001EF2A819|nr:threonine/serine exporter family protein [Cellulomonas sp. ACRRI]MCG7284889.1 threonine/serine exporter family protein [Cellulomonas sp. ACRRI]